MNTEHHRTTFSRCNIRAAVGAPARGGEVFLRFVDDSFNPDVGRKRRVSNRQQDAQTAVRLKTYQTRLFWSSYPNCGLVRNRGARAQCRIDQPYAELSIWREEDGYL